MFERKLPLEFRARESSIDSWIELGYNAEATRQVLSILATAFRWSETDMRRLRPQDELWALYYSYYPPLTSWRRWVGSFTPDELEMETVLKDLQRTAPSGQKVSLGPDITIGDLVMLLDSRR
jgi:hypothetical protein